MKLLFWICFALISYTYFGYALLLRLQVFLRRRPTQKSPITPTVTIIIAVRNEEANLPAKLENLRQLNYPQEKMQIVIASDGSTDSTASILREHADRVCPVILEQSQGKAGAVNEAVQRATGEIIVFLDARQMIDRNAISELVSGFADTTVGAVSGELLLESDTSASTSNALGLYWKIEKLVRMLESATGSVVGVTGAIYAIRRVLYTEIPLGTILDDVFIPLHVAHAGMRVIFQPTAIARDKLFGEKGKEFSRKVRTLTGNYQLLHLVPWLLSSENPLCFRFVSHKLLRLVVPLLLILMFIAAACSNGLIYQYAFWFQVLIYLLAASGAVYPSTKKIKPVSIANTFVMLNVAASVAFYNFLSGRYKVWA